MAIYNTKHFSHSRILLTGLHLPFEFLLPSTSKLRAAMPRHSGRSSPISMNCPSLIIFTSLPGTRGRPTPVITGETSSWRCGVTLGKSWLGDGGDGDGEAVLIKPKSLKAERHCNIPTAKWSGAIHTLIS